MDFTLDANTFDWWLFFARLSTFAILLAFYNSNRLVPGIVEWSFFCLCLTVSAYFRILPINIIDGFIGVLITLQIPLGYTFLILGLFKFCEIKIKYYWVVISLIPALTLGVFQANALATMEAIRLTVSILSAIYIIAAFSITYKFLNKKYNSDKVFILISLALLTLAYLLYSIHVMYNLDIFKNQGVLWLSFLISCSVTLVTLGLMPLIAGHTRIALQEENIKRFEAEKSAKESLSKAKQANATKAKFLAAMSHDLRTPLNAVIGFSDVMLKEIHGGLNNDKYAEYIKDINTSGEYLLTLVNNLLEISTISSNQKVLYKKDINCKELCKSCYDILHLMAENKGLSFILQVPDDLPLLYADRQALMQIVMNVSSNAIKFTPKGGAILIEADVVEDNYIIKITDTGVGISKDNIDIVTQPFKRIDSTSQYEADTGSGLGLSIASELAKLHGGGLTIVSELGQGTTVTISLPMGSSN